MSDRGKEPIDEKHGSNDSGPDIERYEVVGSGSPTYEIEIPDEYKRYMLGKTGVWEDLNRKAENLLKENDGERIDGERIDRMVDLINYYEREYGGSDEDPFHDSSSFYPLAGELVGKIADRIEQNNSCSSPERTGKGEFQTI